MPDDLDRASDYEEKMRAYAIAQRKPALKPCGHCYNCGEPLKYGVFCDADCQVDYEKHKRFREANFDNN